MKIQSQDIYILSELQKNPYQSIRALAKNIKVKKDRVFRSLKKLKTCLGLQHDYWVNYPKIGLKPFTLIVKCPYQKTGRVVAVLKNPYLLELFFSASGEGVYILAKYVFPDNFNMKPILGLMKSWNWIKESYLTYVKSEGYNLSFHYFNRLNQSWVIKWLYWGLMIKDVLINQEASELFPQANMIDYSKSGYDTHTMRNINLLKEITSNPQSSISKIAVSNKLKLSEAYNIRRFSVDEGVLKKFYRVNYKMTGLRERIAVIVKTADSNTMRSILNGFLLLPECCFYNITGELEGLIILLSLPYGGLGKIHNILSDYLFDQLDSYWLLPLFKEQKINHIPSTTLLDENLNWRRLTIIKDKKIILYEDYAENLRLPELKIGIQG
ncbi:MAG: winged helix-turn-helix domain-containing protein [Candidatus Odinarchaeota archaeon]